MSTVGLTSVLLVRNSAVSAPAREAAGACSRSLLGASEGDVSVRLRSSQAELIGVYRPIYPGPAAAGVRPGVQERRAGGALAALHRLHQQGAHIKKTNL